MGKILGWVTASTMKPTNDNSVNEGCGFQHLFKALIRSTISSFSSSKGATLPTQQYYITESSVAQTYSPLKVQVQT
jgi:hypothetical protein